MKHEVEADEAAEAAMIKSGVIIPVTMTCEEAARRHPGFDAIYFRRLCLHGVWLLSRYRDVRFVPEKERRKALFAKKVGRYWVIPITELDRLFLV